MNNQWQYYKELELLPGSMPEPQITQSPIAQRISSLWRSRLDQLAEQLDYVQRIDRLERCYEVDLNSVKYSKFKSILWSWLNQPLVDLKLSDCLEPQIWQTSDRVGNVWWHVYDPATGSTTDLDSEEAVQIWLEERLYH